MFVLRVRGFLAANAVAAVVALIALTATAPVNAQEWTRFRGPNGAGQSDATTIPTEWTEKDINWSIDLPGIGHGSPVVWGEKLFVSSGDPGSGTRMVFAVRTTDGRVLWKREYPATVDKVHVQNSLSSSTPACDAEHVYFAWATPAQFHLMAIDHQGNDVWQAELGKFTSRHGFGASPILYEDLVIITNDQDGDSSMIAVDRANGKIRWKIPRKRETPQNASFSTPLIYTPPGGEDELIVNSWAHGVSSHNPRTGQVNWELPVFDLRTVGSPVLAAGLILGSSGEGAGNNSVVAVRPGDKNGRAPQEVYRFGHNSNNPYVPTIVTAGELAFLWGDKGIVACIDAATGRVHYDKKRVGGDYSASPIRIGDRIFGISSKGEVVVLAASPEFKVLARNQLGDDTRATPAVADGKLFVRTQSKLMSIGGRSQ